MIPSGSRIKHNIKYRYIIVDSDYNLNFYNQFNPLMLLLKYN